MSSEHSILQRLDAIRSDIAYIKKRPSDGLPYPFVAHDDVTECFRKPMHEHGVFCIPSVVSERQEGNRCVLEVNLRFCCLENQEECINVRAVGHGVDNQDKGPGKAYSYAIKMGFLKLFMVPTGEKDVEQHDIDQTYAEPGQVRKVLDMVQAEDWPHLKEYMATLNELTQRGIWSELNSKTRSAITKAWRAMEEPDV
ncbi:MAG: ERF family protein [Candidatus Bathyarchaeota archaeon]